MDDETCRKCIDKWKITGEEECDDCIIEMYSDGPRCRNIEAVSEYASTCDGCGELTSHELLVMDEKSQLGFCPKCTKEISGNMKLKKDQMTNFKDSWKNKRVFEEQLKLNLEELNGRIPSHWRDLVYFIKQIKEMLFIPTTFLDIGCGCGATSALIRDYYPEIRYTGMDYAPEAIELASEKWPLAHFIEKDYKDLTKEETDKYDIVYACSLHNVLSNGDEAIDFLLSLKPRLLILGKILTTHKNSYFETYKAYNLITTYKFFHNYQNLMDKIRAYGQYAEITDSSDVHNYLLKKHYENEELTKKEEKA